MRVLSEGEYDPFQMFRMFRATPPHSLSLVSRSTIRMYLKRLSSTSTLYLCCFMPLGLELSFTDLHIPFHT